MGIYWATYLCFGRFENQRAANIAKKIQVASMNQIIEPKEWKAGVVEFSEIEKHLKDWKIKIEEDSQMDLFMEEGESTTYDFPPLSTSKFILVKHGLKFVKYSEDS